VIPGDRAPAALRHAPHLLLVALVGGAVLALWVRPHPATWLVAGATGAGAAVALVAGRPGPALGLLAATLALAGWAWGGTRIAGTVPPALALPLPVTGTIEVDGLPQESPRGARARVRARDLIGGAGRRVPRGTRLLAQLPEDGPSAVERGQVLRITGRAVAAASARSPGWWRAHLARTGIAARLEVATATAAGRRYGLPGLRDRWRNAVAGAAGTGASGEPRAVVRGMALGGGRDLSEATARAFRDAGLWHLLAVSGQNVTIVALAALAVLRAAGMDRRAATAVAAVVLLAYCLACDGGASVARAGIVGALGLAAQLRSRPAERWYLLLAGLAALVLHQPRAIGDPGLQLSFTAVAGIFVVAPPIATWLSGSLPSRVAELAAQAAGATLATAPVVVWHFGRLSLAGLLVNVVAVPLAGPIVVTALAGAALSAVATAPAAAAGWLAGVGAWVLIALARAAAALPGASIGLPAWTAAIAGLPAAAVPIVARQLWRSAGPPVARPRAAVPLVCAAGAACAGLAAAVAPATPPAPWPVAPAVTALDVGQGDAILLRSPDGAAALVDTGPPGAPAPVLGALRRMGIRRLDVLAITHDQLDHAGAAAEIVDRLDVGTVVAPVPIRGVPVRRIAAGDAVRVGAWRLDVLWPRPGLPAPEDPNDGSLVMRATAPGLTALLPADAESDVLGGLPLGRVDVLKVSHHGSADAGLARVLRRLRPAVALVSVGDPNRHGHPDPVTVATLAEAGAAVLRTDRSGSLTATPGGESPDVALERGG
jgi:competence protein ComEC